ncbi:serine/threonine-protein kinase [Streptomyces sp. AV19]|uniref:protein kinase domain-containing protein n=1 Tax=Streptomyces sp. AV19 TaxID=2793068 RepID=UPI0018FEC202|nr:protein kinase [Streptomyces sp. AV19]MBH1934065.1 serine/threonine-protein kinase [Streptomyces sp. AV19]MDG4535454.1 serine/threonine-protein kinase [Streptomyces sp. AV19]
MNPLGTGDPLRLGPYRLLGVLGEGGMGKVYLGRDGAGRTSAVKVLRPELAHDAHMAQRFVREAQAARAVTGPGVARVLGAWTEGGRPWIATEFLAGPTLDEAVERHGPLGEPAVRALGAALARTLRDIHATGLVHRDLKPSNIVLTSQGPRVIDFGIARPEHGLTLTTTGAIPVTPGYGAPEQTLGQRVGPPGDVFSLGAVLVYAASGRRAYDGAHVAAVQYQVVHGEPDLTGLTPALHALVAPCLAKDPAQRPVPDAVAAAFAPPKGAERAWRRGPLADAIAERERAARRLATHTGVPDGAPAPSRRRFVAGLAAGGTAALAAAGGGAWWLLREDGGGKGPREKEDTPVPRPWDAKRLTADGYREGEAPQPLWGPVDVAILAPPPLPLPDRDLVLMPDSDGLAAFRVADGQRRWGVESQPRSGSVLLPGGLVATGGKAPGAQGRLLVLDSATGREKWSDDIRVIAVIATDGTAVYFTTGRTSDQEEIVAFDLSSRSVRWSVRMPVKTYSQDSARGVAADGRLVLSGFDGDVVALDTRTGRQAWRLAGQRPRRALAPAVSGGVVHLGGRTLTALRLTDGKELWSVAAETPVNVGYGGWSSPVLDGDALYASDGDQVTRRNRHDGSLDWARRLPGGANAELGPAAVQGGSVWVGHGKSVSALHKDTGDPAWTWTRDGIAEWKLAGAGNRIFLWHQNRLTAMPVF